MRVVLVTGGFDPLHSGHIAYFKAAKQLGSRLVVGVNSDDWLTRKKGRPFMPWNERASIISELSCVDEVIAFDDSDNSANFAIYKCLQKYSNSKIIFANGGDRQNDNTPEFKTYGNTPWVQFVWGVGGDDKKNSSSWILKSWSQPTTERAWGRYTVLDKGEGWQVKQLMFDVAKSLSDQRHFKRSEHWHVVEGTIQMGIEPPDGSYTVFSKGPGDSIDIPANTWHKATNVGDIPAKIIEVWLGTELTEEDIERRN